MPITVPATEGQSADGIVLTNVVGVRRRYLRSVNLERDFYTAGSLEGYVLTPAALSALERVATGIHQPSARAWSITGSYGTGKSAFALLATKALAPPPVGDPALRSRLRQQEPALFNRLFSDEGMGFWPVLVTGGREPLIRALLRGLQKSLNHLPKAVLQAVIRDLESHWEGLWEAESTTARDIALLFEDVSSQLRRHVSACAGLIVVVDEMGKFLEYAALHPEQGDMQALQEVAEQAARSRENPILFLTILHQAFEEYAHRLSAAQRKEWQKVQGRFVDVPFGDSPEETLRLLGQAIRQEENADADVWLREPVERQMEACRRLQFIPHSLSASEFRELLRNVYPLHALTALILPYLFRRFGQNERSLFSFLSSEEPFGFQEFLRRNVLTPTQAPLFRPDDLYDYVVRTLGSSLYAHAASKLWGETEEALHRLTDRPPLYSRLVKTIGLLHILGEQTRVLPSKEVLVFALGGDGVETHEIETAIDALESETLITYRNFKKAYRPYEGSDVDIEARLREARAYLTQGTDSIRMAHLIGATPPFVARRHSYETGTLRFFQVRCCRPATLEAEIRADQAGSDGLLLLCLAADTMELATVEQAAGALLSSRPDVIIGVNVETQALHEAAVAVESLLWVQDMNNTPELRGDRVAKREVEERLSDATNAFSTEWDRLLRPQGAAEEGGIWYYRGERVPLGSYRQLQALVSRACDEAYPHTPRLRNELINRRQLSSAAAAARRSLIEAMIERRHLPRLGISGFPPEASMYASVLESTGIHRPAGTDPDGNSVWNLFPPDEEDPVNAPLGHVWREIETFLFGGVLEAKPLNDLNAGLRARPYGLADGLIPVLLCAVLLHHEDEVVVYEEGRFVTELDAATFERMIKRPEDYRLQGCRIAGERQAVLGRFAQGLLRSGVEVTLVNVVRELYRQFNRLPEYTLKTRALEPETLALRDVFKEGREPEQLLFVQLPRLLGARPFLAEEADAENGERFFTRWNQVMPAVVGAYDALLSRLEQALCGAFGVNDWHELQARAASVQPFVTEPRLKAFINRAADGTMERRKWLESVASGVLNRPPSAWSDAEEDRFANLLPPLVSAFQHSELLWFEKKQKTGDEEQIGIRLAVTQDTGAEEAHVVVVPKAEAENIKDLTQAFLHIFEGFMRGKPRDIRIAVLSQAAQEILRGETND